MSLFDTNIDILKQNKIESQSKTASRLFENKIKTMSRPCQDHDWHAMVRQCLIRLCCQDYDKIMLVKTMLDKTMFVETIFVKTLFLDTMKWQIWSILNQFSPFDPVWTCLFKFETS